MWFSSDVFRKRAGRAEAQARAEVGERPHRFRDAVRPHVLRISCGHASAPAQGACGCALRDVQTLPQTLPGCPRLRICVHCGWMRSVSQASKAALGGTGSRTLGPTVAVWRGRARGGCLAHIRL